MSDDDNFHSRRSPSGSAYWLRCGQSVQGIPEGYQTSTSFYAAEGTCAHWLLERCINDPELELDDFLDLEVDISGHKITITQEMCDYLEELLQHVRCLPATTYSEVRVHYDEWSPGDSGSVDILHINRKTKTVSIIDLKYGHNPVDAYKNTQLMCYALGVLNDYPDTRDYEEFTISIYQPRTGGNPWDNYNVSVNDLLLFGEEVRLAALETENPDTPFYPSPNCKYCPRREFRGCEAHDAWVISNLGFEEEEFEEGAICFKDADKLPIHKKKLIYDNIPYIIKWLEALQAEAYEFATIGTPWEGLKLVQGKAGRRYYTDEKEAEKRIKEELGEKAYKKNLISPTELEKLAGKRKIKLAKLYADLRDEGIIKYGETGKVLVDVSDPRPPIDPLSGFDEVDFEDEL